MGIDSVPGQGHCVISVQVMKSILIIPVTLLLLLGLLFSGSDAGIVKVGVYDNEPMIFLDEEGRAAGFYVDLLEHIAAAEGYEIAYVPGTRSECLTWLGDGKIDLLPGIGAEVEGGGYSLTGVTVLSDWGQIYSSAASPVETIQDMSGRTVSVARGDHMYASLRSALDGLGIDCHFVEVDGYSDALRMVSEGVVDACLVPRLYAGRGVSAGLARSTLIGLPADLRFAVGSAAGGAWTGTLDAHITEMREDRESMYYRSQNAWFSGLSVGRFPRWGNWAHIAAIAFLLMLVVMSILHRMRAKDTTRELREEVNDRRLAEQALRASEERFHALYDKMNEGVCLHEMIFDEAGHAIDYVVIDVNPSYSAILGKEREEIIGRRGSELFEAEELPFMEAYAGVAVTERHTAFDAYFPPARRHFRVSAFSPQSGKVAAIFSDVTESKERMDELKTSEGKYRILFENAPDPMYLNDLSGILMEGNAAAEKLLGYSRHELVGENLLKAGLIPLEQTLKAANNISLCAQGKPTGPDDFTLIRKDGTTVETEISTHPVKVDGQTLALGIIRDVSERKHTEATLKESEERLRSVYESMGDSIIISNLNGTIQQVNRSALEMLGYVSKEEMVGSHSYLCIAEEDRQRASEEMMRALKANERISDEYRFLKKGGGAIVCEVDVDLLRDRDGNAVGFVMLARDITERKEQELSMREDVSKYKSLLEGLDEAVFRVSLPVGKYTYVSPSVKRVFGYTSEEFLKNPLLMRKLIHRDHAQYFNDMWKDLIQGHIQPSYEYRIVDRDDDQRWVLQTNRRVFNEAGKVIAIEGIWRDITEQKQVDDSLRENEEQFRSMFEVSTTAMEFYDADRRLVHANRACLDLLGIADIKELRKLNLLVGEHTPDEAQSRLGRDRPVSWEITLDFEDLRQNGIFESRKSGKAHLEISVSPVDVGDGSPMSYMAEIRDVSEDKNLGSHVRQYNSLDSTTRLARAMARDFNNILTGIMGYSEHLSGELADNESLHGEAEEIRKAAEEAVERTRQLLTFSRSGSIESAPVDLNALIEESRGGLSRTLGEDKNLDIKLDSSVGEVRADREQIGTLLVNLAANARDAMRSGQTLTISTEAVDIDDAEEESPEGRRSGHFARITVTDPGAGMDDDVMQHLFEPFFTTRDDRSGMGLAVVYGSVRQHSGWLEVSSEPDKGTRFDIFLPASAVPEENFERQSAGVGRLRGGGERVLIVEDDEIVRTMAAKVLRDRGYFVSAAGSAGDARNAFEAENRKFDLVFCDIVLPDGNGLNLAEDLRAMSPDLKVLLTSGYADRRAELSQLGDRDFPLLEKPYALFDLLTAVKDTLGQPMGVNP